jgi:hypothetical protein
MNLALVKAKNMKGTGAVLSISGAVPGGSGIVLFFTSPPTPDGKAYECRGGGVLLTRLGLTAVEIPLWTIGGHKKMHIDNALAKFKVSASINGIGLKIRF